MPYFTNRPRVFQAIQWTGDNLDEMTDFFEGQPYAISVNTDGSIHFADTNPNESNYYYDYPVGTWIAGASNYFTESDMQGYIEVSTEGAPLKYLVARTDVATGL